MGDYIIETKELGLRRITQNDFDAWHSILSDPVTMEHYPSAFDEDKTHRWIEWTLDSYNQYDFGLWAVILKERNQFIGDCGITMQNIHGDGVLYPEIGYHIDRRFWNKGYASQAAKACVKYIFEHKGFDAVYCYQKYTNIASRKVAEKLGMTLIAEYEDKVNSKTSVYRVTKNAFMEIL